jgi:hypothetical protein
MLRGPPLLKETANALRTQLMKVEERFYAARATSTAGLLLQMRELSRNIEEEDESLQTLVRSIEAASSG